MTRDNDNSRDMLTQNEHQRGWEHIPSNDNDEIVSPIPYLSPTSNVRDPSRSPRKSKPEPNDSNDAPALLGKIGVKPDEEEMLHTMPRLKKRRFFSEWWLEMLTAVLSMLCAVVIIVILYKVNGTPLADWDEPVSLNAVISVLSTAVKAGLILPVAECISQLKWIYLKSSKSRLEQLQVFDSASRGPAGSFLFFLQARRVPLVSYFACLIVILAVALDPFTQQVIEYNQSTTPIPHLNSTVRHSQDYDRGISSGTNWQNRQNDDSIMFGMMSGLYGKLPLPPFTCPGVNCTYPAVTTLGMCSYCEDVTDRVVADCVVLPYTDFDHSWCNYTLPGGSSMTANETMAPFGLNYPTINTSTSDEPNTQPLILGGDLNKGIVGTTNMTTMPTLYNMNFVRFDAAEEIGINAKANGTDWMKTMTAHECVFQLCAWSFSNWSHLDGVLQAGSVAQSRLRVPNPVVETYKWDQYAPFVFETVDPDFPGNQTYSVNTYDRRAMLQTFYTAWDRTTGGEAATYFAHSLYMADRDIPRTLDTIARSMTYSMMDGPNATSSLGQVFETQTFIYVRWEWLTLTIVVVLGSVALLATTIVSTCAAHQRAWKSSLAPFLYADLKMVPGDNGGRDRDEEGTVRRKAVIGTGLLAGSALGTAAALSS